MLSTSTMRSAPGTSIVLAYSMAGAPRSRATPRFVACLRGAAQSNSCQHHQSCAQHRGLTQRSTGRAGTGLLLCERQRGAPVNLVPLGMFSVVALRQIAKVDIVRDDDEFHKRFEFYV